MSLREKTPRFLFLGAEALRGEGVLFSILRVKDLLMNWEQEIGFQEKLINKSSKVISLLDWC